MTASPSRSDEWLGHCPLCGSEDRALLFRGAKDVVFGVDHKEWDVHRCHRCRCLHLDPRPSRAAQFDAYTGYFTHDASDVNSLSSPVGWVRKLRNDYLAQRFGYPLKRRVFGGRFVVPLVPVRRERYHRLVRDLPKPQEGARLLDVGCGNGEFLARMSELGFSVYGQDLDGDAVRVATERGLRVLHGPLRRDAFDAPFDAITLNHVIEHVHDPKELLRTCRALLAPGGTLWLATPNAESRGFQRYGAHWVGLDVPRHLLVFSERALWDCLASAGFGSVHVRCSVGAYGVSGTSAALLRRARDARTNARPPLRMVSWLRRVVHDSAGDFISVWSSNAGDDLVATAKGQ